MRMIKDALAFAYIEAKYRALRCLSRKLSFSRIRFYNLFYKRRPTNVNCSKVWTFNFKNVVDESWDLMASDPAPVLRNVLRLFFPSANNTAEHVLKMLPRHVHAQNCAWILPKCKHLCVAEETWSEMNSSVTCATKTGSCYRDKNNCTIVAMLDARLYVELSLLNKKHKFVHMLAHLVVPYTVQG